MLKYLSLVVIFLVFLNNTYAQVRSDTLVYYVTKSNDIVASKDLADYTLVILPMQQVNGQNLFPVFGYYLNGNKKLIAMSRTNNFPLVMEGQYISFFPNGNRRTILSSSKGEPKGDEINYYPNGRIYTKTKHEQNKIKLFECLDSLGNELTINGNGKWIVFDEDFKKAKRLFNVKEGLELSMEESFANSVKRKTWPGEEKYLSKIGSPEYTGNYDELQKLLKQRIDLSIGEAINIDRQVYAAFFVEPDGSLSDFNFFPTQSETINKELVEILRSSSSWKPTIKNGKSVKTPFILPIFFPVHASEQDSTLEQRLTDSTRMPSFYGGTKAFIDYLNNNMKYPAFFSKKAKGELSVSFIVETDGSLSNIHITKTPSIDFSEDVLRTMRSSPRWVAGTNADGVHVRAIHSIKFSLN